MEESVLERIYQLMAGQSAQARREVELTNVPVVVAQVERFRARGSFGNPGSTPIKTRVAPPRRRR